jgi:pyridoxal phosphate enzyme (YggS family)
MNGGRIAENLAAVRGRIAAAAERAGRDPGGVRLVAVSKTFPAAAVIEAFHAGQTEFGENRVQEAEPKIAAVAADGLQPHWHLIGHLQSNKIRRAVQDFAIIESIDSERLARAVAERVHASTPFPVLVEVNVGGEASKSGFAVDETPGAVAALRALPSLDVRGLMTVAPQASDPEEVRPLFRRLAELARRLDLPELSMGMSGDFEVAIAEGATIVRVGTAIFGHRWV